jgi:uncharacterized phage protein gp47/JayE
MANMSQKDFNTLVSDFATAVQGSAAALLDFTVGSILRALGEAIAGVVVWLEGLILILLQTTRLSTSSGNDVDTFVNDFGYQRLPAVAADGSVTFARFTPTMQAQIPVGATVQTADGTQSYTVIADTTQSAYNAATNAYIIAPGTASITATVQAVNTGSQGNVGANTITIITGSIPYVDTVTNAAAFTSGQDAETDAQVKTGFVAYLASLAKATAAAIVNAVTSLQVGATCVITQFYAYNGTYQPGYFYAVVDDGSGAPPSGFISNASNAIDATRACGIQFNVFGPVTVTANVAMTITAASGYVLSTLESQVQSAIQSYIGSLALGQTCEWSKLAAIAYSIAGVANVTVWTLNGGTSDLIPTSQQRIIAGTVTVN